MTYSSTVLKTFTDYCPAALGFYEKQTPRDKSIFQAGIAAHAVLQAVGEKGLVGGKEVKALADAVTEELITKGRAYNGVPEPPMSPASAFEGRDIAINYLEYHPIMEDGKYEIGLAMDIEGRPCGYYGDKTRYRAIIDRVYMQKEGDEEWAGNLVVVSDYKSAWTTNASELETLQRKGQAVLAFKKYGSDKNLSGLRMEAVNIRTGRAYHKDLWFDTETIDLLKKWEDDILMICRAADETRVARAGANCIGCPYLHACEDGFEHEDIKDQALSLALIEANRKELIKALKEELKDINRMDVPGGYVGYKEQSKMKLTDSAIYNLIAEWYGVPVHEVPNIHPLEVGMLSALNLGSGQINAIAKNLFDRENMEKRTEFASACLENVGSVTFGVWKEKSK